jgi:hypothetical protein
VESYQKLQREETKLSTSLQEAVESRPLKDSTQTDAGFPHSILTGQQTGVVTNGHVQSRVVLSTSDTED